MTDRRFGRRAAAATSAAAQGGASAVRRTVLRHGGSRRTILAASPAAAALLGSTLLLAPMYAQNPLTRYERLGEAALLSRDFATARVCFERLVRASPDNPRFRQGLHLATEGAL